jgi:hypothetical protein
MANTRESAMGNLEKMKLEAEIKRLLAESDKLMSETRWYPFVVVSGLVVGIITLTKLFLN